MTELKAWLRRTLPLLFDKDNTVQTLEIPLFPLNTVLFPGGRLPLRVFEQRYMEMAKDCLRNEQPFGVCLIREGGETGTPAVPEEVGCMARIGEWDMHQLGVLNLTVTGERRFAIEQYHAQPDGLIRATVSTVSAEEPQAIPEHLLSCATVLRTIVAEVGEANFQAPLAYDDAVWVGYRLTEVLPLKLIVKQKMLEMNAPTARLEILKKFLGQQGLVV